MLGSSDPLASDTDSTRPLLSHDDPMHALASANDNEGDDDLADGPPPSFFKKLHARELSVGSHDASWRRPPGSASVPSSPVAAARKRTRTRTFSYRSGGLHALGSPAAAVALDPVVGCVYRPFAQRMQVVNTLEGHDGCVNTVTWSPHGEFIASGSDDQIINIWAGDTGERVHRVVSGHTANIFSVKWMPNDPSLTRLISCAADGNIRYTELSRAPTLSFAATGSTEIPTTQPGSQFRCHQDMTYMVLPDPDSDSVFYSCSDDGHINRYDLRERTSCNCHGQCTRHSFINYQQVRLNVQHRAAGGTGTAPAVPEQTPASTSRSRLFERLLGLSPPSGVTCLDFRPDFPAYLAASSNDDRVSVFDKRQPTRPVYQFVPPFANSRARARVPHKITDCRFDPLSVDGELLVSYSDQDTYLVRPTWANETGGEGDIVQRYTGHCNEKTMIKESNFFGSDLILGGSDDGNLFIWDRATGHVLDVLEGDGRIVNCVQPHPDLPYLLTAGIDDSIKVMQPSNDPPGDTPEDLPEGLDPLAMTDRPALYEQSRRAKVFAAVRENLRMRSRHPLSSDYIPSRIADDAPAGEHGEGGARGVQVTMGISGDEDEDEEGGDESDQDHHHRVTHVFPPEDLPLFLIRLLGMMESAEGSPGDEATDDADEEHGHAADDEREEEEEADMEQERARRRSRWLRTGASATSDTSSDTSSDEDEPGQSSSGWRTLD
ncbi:hypothetical protein AMAG_05604 [Allomyces macrogynus ATCC 38327]|uniref:Anaphase-promoting complex subunit 4 WD40 domain-containing protein n=1 Tax=Allomyces macrogynus (strain ATCC 38327) TaxID=578462 RepID=A0A0L0SCR7_ALLM3|nr:hypothetical protein AMAG_05604 [Allomyces macrogynus ATCC 38327]|eukprot:KNE60185.1 hypothetical protein AMAG_05604 [Allomyces macrogynus ATCC 38327]